MKTKVKDGVILALFLVIVLLVAHGMNPQTAEGRITVESHDLAGGFCSSGGCGYDPYFSVANYFRFATIETK